jgi:hypothetical protein
VGCDRVDEHAHCLLCREVMPHVCALKP